MALLGDIKGKVHIYKFPEKEGEQMKKMTQEVVSDRPVTHIVAAVCNPAGAKECMVSVNSLSGTIKLAKLQWDLGFAKAAKFEVVKVFATVNRAATIRAAFCPPLGIWPKSHTVSLCFVEPHNIHCCFRRPDICVDMFVCACVSGGLRCGRQHSALLQQGQKGRAMV